MPKSLPYDLSHVERGLNYLVVWQYVLLEGQRQMLPVLYALHATSGGVKLFRSDVLIKYLADHDAKSGQWMLERVRAVGMLIEYTAACLPYFQPAQNRGGASVSYSKVLTRFAKAVLNGTTIVENGRRYDGVGLYWPPRREASAKRLLAALTSVLKWISLKASEWFDVEMGKAQEPFHAVRIAYQHVIQRKKSLLAHLKSEKAAEISHPFGALFGSGSPRVRTYRFPTKYVWPLLFRGFQNSRNKPLDETAQVIALLLFAGGSRLSELFNAWVNDLQWVNGEPVLFLHHPRNGDIRTGGKTINRRAYLENDLRPTFPPVFGRALGF